MNNSDLLTLLHQRRLLLKQLVECSNQQVKLVEKKDDEDFSTVFLQTFEEWNNLKRQVEETSRSISLLQTESEQERGFSAEVAELQQIAENVEFIQSSLREFMYGIGDGMQEISNQRKIVNAYYGGYLSDTSAIYFDAKK